MSTENKKKTLLDHYERVVDNIIRIIRIMWLILLANWIYTNHTI